MEKEERKFLKKGNNFFSTQKGNKFSRSCFVFYLEGQVGQQLVTKDPKHVVELC